MNTSDLQNVLDHLKQELGKIKTGRANPGMLEDIQAEAYGSKMPLKELATISIPEARQFLISPYDKGNIKAIESALNQANLGSSPQTQEDNIRLTLPPMTEETRKKEAAEIHQKAEGAKIQIRELRHKTLNTLKDEGLSEEEVSHKKKETEEIVHEYTGKIDKLAKEKEEEVMKI